MGLRRVKAVRRVAAYAAAVWIVAAGSAMAQTAGSPFGGFKHDSTQPIEVAADSLEVRNADRVAVFRGDVDVRQGEMRMRADRIEVSYAGAANGEVATGVPGAGGSIDKLRAVGDVIISNGKEQAEGGALDYDVTSGKIILRDNVMLIQGENIISGGRLEIDLTSGVGRMVGRTTVVLTPTRRSN